MAVSLRHRWVLARQLNTPPKPSLTYIRRDALYEDVLLLAKKRVYKLIFQHQKCVYRHKNNIKPKKAKSFLDIVVKNWQLQYNYNCGRVLRNHMKIIMQMEAMPFHLVYNMPPLSHKNLKILWKRVNWIIIIFL